MVETECCATNVEWTLQVPARPVVHTAILRPELAAICFALIRKSVSLLCASSRLETDPAGGDIDGDGLDLLRRFMGGRREGLGEGETLLILTRFVEQVDPVAGSAYLEHS